MTEFEKIIKWRPAFDKRNPNPSKNYGIGAMRIYFVLSGNKGSISFTMDTGWYLKHNRDQLKLTGHSVSEPMGCDLGYHSPAPMYEGQSGRENCEWLGGKTCYGDGSALASDEVIDGFIENGEAWLWKQLEEEYRERFEDANI